MAKSKAVVQNTFKTREDPIFLVKALLNAAIVIHLKNRPR